ncbi:helix-turn-helix transcriptional regulator [Cognataquiflexum rubidum]|uniref:helix-turn-helix transcriptional regulator n=1 Tax=Cognataquiflexum rubidum TaxID=2922273 RepID=UPI001F13E516|nr:helix-turn-helix transcriptional regulator [Cognataquiflexum rubidum]MCH6232751.1 helix-turn-helix transcriptional regulator [Cognataquiflexum rubidum]
MDIVKIPLTIERQVGKELWGRIMYNDNLITDFAETVPELEAKIKALLWDFEKLAPEYVEFTHQYDIYALFQKFDFLKISTIAEHAGMNPGLLRQYVSGVKSPSIEQAKKIEKTLHNLAAEMQGVIIVTS